MSKLIPPDKNLSPSEKIHLPMLKQIDHATEIHLGGTAITEAGNMTQHNYFKFLNLDLDDYSNISYTEEEAVRIRGHLSKLSTGASAMVPMICSPLCPFRDRCVFFKMEKAPFGKQCLYEVNLLREWVTGYFKQYEVDPNNITEVRMINELAECEIYEWRLNMNLAKPENAELVTDSIVNMTPQGEPLYERKLSVFLEGKEKLAARRARLVKLMVGDRQEKYKKEAALKQRETDDPSSSMADLRGRLEKLQRDLTKREIALAEDNGKMIEGKIAPPTPMSAEDIINSTDE